MGAGAFKSDPSRWTVDETIHWVKDVWVNEFEKKFKEAGVDGKMLMSLNEDNVCDLLKMDKAHAASILAYIRPLQAHGRRQSTIKPLGKGAIISVDNFDMTKRIGKGAFGDVYMATMIHGDGLDYAIKVLDKAHIAQTNTLENVLDEKKILKMCHEPVETPFIVQLKYAFQDEKKLYLTLSLVEGGDVYANLEAQPTKSFPVETCRFYAYEIFLALDWMHKKRIIYRDLKAENVLIGNDGHIVMTDLGLAKHWSDPDAEMHSTSICGTPEYMPPEVIREEGHSIAMDYWGLGVLTYEMMCGNTPFSSDDAKGLFVNILMHDPAFPEQIPDDACQCVLGLLDKNPDDRLGVAGDGASELQHCAFFSVYDREQMSRKEIPPPNDTSSSRKGLKNIGEQTYHSANDGAEFADFENYEYEAKEGDDVSEGKDGFEGEEVSNLQDKLKKEEQEVRALKEKLQEEESAIEDLDKRKANLLEEVTQVKRTLEERANQLDLVINLVPHMICAKNKEGKYVLSNDLFARTMGLTADTIVGRNQLDISENKQEAQRMLEVDKNVISKKKRVVMQFTVKGTIGATTRKPKTLKVTKIPYEDSGEECVLAIGEDITTFIENEQKVKDKLETLQLNNNELTKKIQLMEQQLQLAKYKAENPSSKGGGKK